MFVCICNAISDTELRDAARKCPGGAKQVYASLGKQVNCGQCLCEAESIVFEARDEPLLAAE